VSISSLWSCPVSVRIIDNERPKLPGMVADALPPPLVEQQKQLTVPATGNQIRKKEVSDHDSDHAASGGREFAHTIRQLLELQRLSFGEKKAAIDDQQNAPLKILAVFLDRTGSQSQT